MDMISHAPSWVAVTCVVATVTAVFLVRWKSKRSILHQHEPISLASMYQLEGTHIGVCYETFEQVLNLIGQAYTVDPKRLRPSDKLEKLYDLDSWELYAGTEKLSFWLEKSFDITSFETEPETIAELIKNINSQESERDERDEGDEGGEESRETAPLVAEMR
jgi:hypothetical protein